MLDYDLFKKTPTDVERTNALQVQRRLGYTLFCAAARMILTTDGAATVEVQIENRGVSPLYAAWPVDMEALDKKGDEVVRGRALWPLQVLLPGQTAHWSVAFNIMPATATTVVLRIPNPMQRGHGVAFANAEMGTVLNSWLTLNVPAAREINDSAK